MPVKPANRHLDRVYAAVDGKESRAEGAVSASWKRSATSFGIDPMSDEPPRILTTGELRDCREQVERLIVAAREELDHLYRVVSPARYVVLLTNDRGVAIDHRGNPADAAEYVHWGTWIGGVWAEEVEGTNGIGTCIAERRPVTVHQAEHFRARHISLSCSGAPMFGSDGELIGVLDISSIDPNLSEHSHTLAGSLVIESARAIEERHFRERFRRHFIVAVPMADGSGRTALLAVDKDRVIVGADRNARAGVLHMRAIPPSGLGFWTLFEADHRAFRGKDGDDDARVLLTPVGGGLAIPALVTPPETPAAIWRNSAGARFHTRPRVDPFAIDPLALAGPAAALPQARGGLPPRALRRVEEYIDAHLSEGIELEGLAAIAGLSLHHFARAFKMSAGIPPHAYLLQRRVDKARDLLSGTDHPMSDIALAAGFADQSHLARHFRQIMGVSPGAFRRSHR